MFKAVVDEFYFCRRASSKHKASMDGISPGQNETGRGVSLNGVGDKMMLSSRMFCKSSKSIEQHKVDVVVTIINTRFNYSLPSK